MPIYAYKCSSCGHAKDVLQKISDAPLSVCPACGTASFAKQVTAAGFQLKGSGWYVTDFRDNGKKKDNKSPDTAKVSEPAANDSGKPADTSKPAESAKPAESSTATASPPPPSSPTPSA